MASVDPIATYLHVKRQLGGNKPSNAWELDQREDEDFAPIYRALRDLQRPYAIGGFFDRISFLETFDRLSLPWGTVAHPDVGAIKRNAKVAPFGKGSEIVVDQTVRNAWEIKADQLHAETLKTLSDAVIDKVQWLAPPGRKLYAIPYKMHIYEKGGFFHKHKDTLHAPEHMATLVMYLPVKHQGGELNVECPSNPNTYMQCDYDDDTWKSVVWYAFYTDCVHEVTKVTDGTRITLQYDLYLDPEEEKDEDEYKTRSVESKVSQWFEEEDPEDMRPLPEYSARHPEIQHTTEFSKALTTYWSAHPSTRLGILLEHEYTPSSLQPQYLKGYDEQLYRLCQGFTVELRMVLLHSATYVMCDDDATFWATPLEIDSASGGDIIDGDGDTPSAKRQKRDEDQTTVILVPQTDSYLKQLVYSPYVEMTGNEPAPQEYTYISAVMLLSRKG